MIRAAGGGLLGEGPGYAARQAAVLFALAGLLAVVSLPSQPDRWHQLLPIAAADLLAAGMVWPLPWDRWGPNRPLLLSVPAFAILGFSTWAFGGFAAGTGPFFVLFFAWVGLHYPVRPIVALVPAALVAYVAPLVITHQSSQVLGSAMVLLPIAVGVAAMIATQVAHLREARAQILAMERWRATLTATLAHDVRSPLTAIRAGLGVVRRFGGRLPPERRDAILATADRQAARIQRLAEGLLDVERVDTRGELRLDRQPVNLRAAVLEAMTYLDPAGVVVDLPRDLLVNADPQRLEQILVNLVANAQRHGRPPVVITTVPAGDLARLEIRDYGTGVPAARLADLFTRFGAGDSTESVGLGLWVARELARAHGGEVWYEPADPGARFCVTLPVAPGPGAPPANGPTGNGPALVG